MSPPSCRSTKGRVHRDPVAAAVGGHEAQLLEDALHHGVKAARADVLHAAVHLGRDARERGDALGRELHRHALGGQEPRILARQRVLRLGQDADEVVSVSGWSSTRIGRRP
jgi:hypothetical protein